jgi:hypothetical protein
MQVNDRLDNDVVDSLGRQFSALINKDHREISHGEVLRTAVALINATIESIHCPGCRAASIEFAKEEFDNMIEWTRKGSPPTTDGNTLHIH